MSGTIEDVATVLPLIGRGEDDGELKRFLTSVGSWPIPEFKADEHTSAHVDHERGFELQFRAAETLKHPRAAGATGRKAVLFGTYLYAGGKFDYKRFTGALPKGVTWSDTVETLTAKLGEPTGT